MLAIQHRTLGLRSVPSTTLQLGLLLSVGGLSFGLLQGWPVWADGSAVLLPWLPILAVDPVWVYRRYQWLAVFYLLVVSQSGHFIEHIAQMIQIHVLGLSGAEAQGIFGALNIETVHFLWNTWVIVAAACLLWRFPSNAWLKLTVMLAGWHEVEHAVIFWMYLTTGLSGTPGLLSQGGLILGGLPIIRPDLHFIYNATETLPLYAAFLSQVQRVSITATSNSAPSGLTLHS